VRAIAEHDVEPWTDRDGDVVGASVFLTPEEVAEMQETGSVEIEAAD
jgi:hypothetical protein